MCNSDALLPAAGSLHVGAVILAGGLARRMGGQDKGLVPLAGKPMISYALDTILPLVSECVINANRNQQHYAALAPESVHVISDSRDGHLGPLAGLSAALDYLSTDYVLMCPCDSPFLHAKLVASLMHQCAAQDADIAVAHDGERLQPVFIVVHQRVADSLNAFLDSGERKIDHWFLNHSVVEVDATAYIESFRNINSQEELVSAEKDLLS